MNDINVSIKIHDHCPPLRALFSMHLLYGENTGEHVPYTQSKVQLDTRPTDDVVQLQWQTSVLDDDPIPAA